MAAKCETAGVRLITLGIDAQGKPAGRDGALALLQNTHQYIFYISSIATHMQSALDNWEDVEGCIKTLQMKLDRRDADLLRSENCRPYDQTLKDSQIAPLPRAYQWLDGSAYINHVELVRKARGATVPETFYTSPLMYQGGSDHFLAPQSPIAFQEEDFGIDFEGEIGVIVGDVPMGCTVDEASKLIRLVVLLNDVSLRKLIPAELAKGFGFVQSKPPTACAPIAVSPEALGEKWRGGKFHGALHCHVNDTLVGWANAGVDMTFSFPELIAHAAKTRPLCSGTIVGSGTVSNSDQQHGYSCIAEIRAIETIKHGSPVTQFLKFGDRVRLEVLDEDGETIFGSIQQEVLQHKV